MQSSSTNPDEAGEVSEINITPLADVTLVLLIILMLLSPLAMQSMIQVQASQAVATKSAAVTEKPLFVDITTAGFTVNSQSMSTELELFRTLQRNLVGKHDKTVLVSSAADVRYENVVRVLDLVKQSGASSLSLVPRKKEVPST